ncbi:hypothetical protein XELAEV_18001309mg [Xenopus laevis]|nr:hypothetical protein XELAEV_18001309mg [Xenopus laevis]
MAGAAVREELICLICLEIYREPVTLACGHTFCQGCIGKTWDEQWEREKEHTCPECRHRIGRRPDLKRNPRLHNLVNLCLRLEKMATQSFICCLNCDSPTEALQSCLTCEISLCPTHLGLHQLRYPDHIMCEPLTDFGRWKCPIHKKILESYCTKDGAFICESCCLDRKHRDHRVELLSEASEKKKEKLGNILEKLSPEREETERGAQRLQERRREVEEKAAGETQRVTALFRDIREQLEALEKSLLRDISREQEKVSHKLHDLIQKLEIKKDELSRKIRHIEELCNMADPLTVLQERESHGAADNEGGRERHDIKVPAVGDLDVDLISETLLTGLAAIVTGVKEKTYWCEATGLLLDINTAGGNLYLSSDRKSASWSDKSMSHPQERIPVYPQVLSSRRFPSGRYYWEVKGSESGAWTVGVAYPSNGRTEDRQWIGYDSRSWCLCRGARDIYSVRHGGDLHYLPHAPSCRRIRISLDYEAGRLSFYELSEPIRHLHTFTATFTEPLHAAFRVLKGTVTIVS